MTTIYQESFVLKKENRVDDKFVLDLDISIISRKFKTKAYDKREIP